MAVEVARTGGVGACAVGGGQVAGGSQVEVEVGTATEEASPGYQPWRQDRITSVQDRIMSVQDRIVSVQVRLETASGSSPPSRPSSSTPSSPRPSLGRSRLTRHPRNYKNMTRERRIEANARERTRVHMISAAFETLRKSIPAYSHNQKLSKLSVLRVAASYILTLSRVLGEDYSPDSSAPSLADCVQNVSNTIQMEGKIRKKRDE